MEEPVKIPTPANDSELSFWDRHRISVLLGGSVIVAIILTIVSMTLYNISGTAQLDLSRPGTISVSDKVDTETKIDTFSSTGPVDTDTIKEFITMYDEQVEKAKAVDAFNGDPLNPEVLIPQSQPATSE